MRPARFVVALAVTACATTPPPAQSPADPGAAVNALARAYWAFQMARYPTWATYLGDRRHDDRLADLSDAAHERDLARVRDLKERLSATPADGLSPQDMITREVLGTTLDDELDGEVCRERLWKVDQLDGYQVTLAELPNYHTITTRKNADDLVARYRAVGPLFDQHLANLRVGLSRGLTAARINVERVVEQLGELLAIPPEKSAYLLAAEQLPASFADADRQAITAALLAAVKESVVPALERYRDFLRGTYQIGRAHV